MTFNVQLRPLSDIDARTEAAWAELALQAVERNPFFEPTAVQALVRNLGGDIKLLTVERGSDLLPYLPLMARTFMESRVRLEAWTGWDPISVPLVDVAADCEAALHAAISQLSRIRGPGFLVLDPVPADGAVATALGRVAAGRRPAWLLA